MPITSEMLENWFIYHAPEGNVAGKPISKIEAYQRIRDAGKEFAQYVVLCTPECADQTATIRLIRQAVMTANQAIACGGR